MSDQISFLQSKFQGKDFYSQAVTNGLAKTDDLYVDYLGQVLAKDWSTPGGRVVMVGDAAYCATPMSGVGTSLALAGAYILAGEVAKGWEEPKVAMRRYQEVMSKFSDKAQNLPPGVPGIAHPDTKWGIWVLHNVIRVLASLLSFWTWSGLGAVLEKIMPEKKKDVLPDYSRYIVKRE
jgi:2-polyprenyl-6-methoxyphenol hydroxylase-like FAD-dependent oxidoreductase